MFPSRVLQLYLLWLSGGTFCTECGNSIPLKFHSHCPFLFCPFDNDVVSNNLVSRGHDPSQFTPSIPASTAPISAPQPLQSVDEASSSLSRLKGFIWDEFSAARPVDIAEAFAANIYTSHSFFPKMFPRAPKVANELACCKLDVCVKVESSWSD